MKKEEEIGTFELSDGALVDIPLNKDYKSILAELEDYIKTQKMQKNRQNFSNKHKNIK